MVTRSLSALRIMTIIAFIGLAIYSLWLIHSETTWIICPTEIGKFFASTLRAVGPDLAAMVIGILTIDALAQRRQDEQLKMQLIRQLGSRHIDVADTALNELRFRGWGFSTHKALVDAYLEKANLEASDLNRINLKNAKMRYANLRKADLSYSNLIGIDLTFADLTEASLVNANCSRGQLEKGRLCNADLSGTNLIGANLSGVDFTRANLTSADLRGANLENTILEGAIMDRTNLEGVNLKSAKLNNVDLSTAYLKGTILPWGPSGKV